MNVLSGFSHTEPSGLNHEALLYRSDVELEHAMRTFVSDASAAREPILAALPAASTACLEGVLGALGGPRARIEDLAAMGANPSCLLPVIEDWVREHDGRARVISEPVWPGRSRGETVECLRHEALLNHALADAPATILCPYDAARLEGEVLAGVELTHPRVLEGGVRRASRGYEDPLQTFAAARWPLPEPIEPVSEFAFDGSLSALRHAVSEDPIVARMRIPRRADLVFVVNEAATNAIRHGDGRIRARLWRDAAGVVSEVRCTAAIADAMAGRRRPSADPASARGLWLINHICDLVELRTGDEGTALRMHVYDGRAATEGIAADPARR